MSEPDASAEQVEEAPVDGAAGGDVSEKRAQLSRRKSILDDITGVGDMVLLDPLTEDQLVQNLYMRYLSDEIYVSESSTRSDRYR